MRRLLVLLFSTFILLSTASAASAVRGRGGGRRHPDDHQNGSERSNTPPERERRPGARAAPSPDTGLAPPPLHASLKITEHSGGLPTVDSSSSATIHLNTRLFQTVRKEISTTISLPTVFSPASDALSQEDDHNTLSKPHVPTPPATSTASAPRNATPPVYRLGAVFEPEHIQSLSSVFFQSLQEQNRLLGDLFRLEGVAIETPMLTLGSLKGTCETLQRENVSVGLAVGVTQSIYASGTLASLAGVSLIARTIRGYRDDTLKSLLPDLVVANPRLSDLWGAATSFISTLDWYQPILIHDDSPQALQLAHIASRDTKYDTVGLSLSANLQRHHFQNRLSGILHTVRRLIFVSGTVNFVKVVFSYGEDLDMFNGEYIWILLDVPLPGNLSESLRPGLLSLRPDYLRTPQRQLLINFVKSSISVISEFFKETNMTSPAMLSPSAPTQCQVPYRNLSTSQFELHRQLKEKLESSRISQRSLPGVTPFFYVENLVKKTGAGAQWKRVGYINGSEVQINAIFWPGRGYKGVSEQNKRLRVAMADAPPFVMSSSLIENATCLLGIICLRVFSPEVAATFADMEREVVNASRRYEVVCCSGLSVDLMINVATDLEIELQVYLVMDGTFGSPRSSGWTGIVGDLLDGSADLSFAPLSVTAQRARHLDFSDPYFFSSISILSSTKQIEVPLLAFLVPFSPELWIAIFVSLNITAFSVAVYEWLSPFGLNPWGRQRSKNFSYGSALWVIWGLLFSHLVAFKAPKSWPNKVLINVWGAFSVIFVASYTANIAALFAGLFQTRDHHDRNIMSLRVGSVRASSAEYYVSKVKPDLWEHMKPNLVNDFTTGLQRLRLGTLDLMVGDSAVLDYLRANDPGCTLARHGEDLVSDSFAISMGKGFPLRVKINTILARYLASGHLDHLKHKWYGELPCFNRISADLYKPQALEISTVGGVFLMLTLGIGVGIFLLFLEHLVYRYVLPTLRTKPKGSVWRNRNLMFFSQKLYKFINCVELVSPHHSAKELANSLRTGQIMGLFQKSVKRKENEQRRRRKSKAQFFEMIQEIRRVQKEEKEDQVILPPTSATSTTVTEDSRRGEPTLSHPPEVTPAPPSPFSTITTTTTTTQAPITIDYLPGPNPHEDSEGIIVVNSAVPLGLMEELSSQMGVREEVGRDDDSGSGILILKVSDPEEVLEANTFNQQLEDTQTYKLQDVVGECEVCTCQEGGASRRKASGGCLNCLQRQDSARMGRRTTDGTCYPCSSVTSARENPLNIYPIAAGIANGLRHRGSVPNPPTSHLPSPSLRPATAPSTAAPSPGVMQQMDVSEVLEGGTRSLEDLEARTRHSLGEESYESVRLVPLSQQTAIRSSGSLQVVASLSPGRERVNSDLLRHVTKADLWQLWQDSEKELRVRLRQAESQRDELLRQMSKASDRDHHPLTEGSSEEWDNKSLEDTMAEAKMPYVADQPVSRRTEDTSDFPRSARRMSRERHVDETRLKNSRRDSSTTPRKRKRPRSKSTDYLETRKSSESLEDKKLHYKVEERVTPRKHSSRRKRDGSQDHRAESDEAQSLLRQLPLVHHSLEGATDSTDLVDPLSEYCPTPLPLLQSLHQQSKSDAERNYAFLQSLTPDRRDERLPHDTYSDLIHLKTFCREVKGRGCESDEQIEEDSRLKKSEEEKLSIRRRRGMHHGVGGHGEAQTRRPRERHPSRELYEGPHRLESPLQRDSRQSLPRRPYERETRDHSSPYSGSFRQQQQQPQPQPQPQLGVRRHTTFDSSSDPEEPLYSTAQSLEAGSTREAHGRRQPSQHPYPRTYEGRRAGDRKEDRRSSERKTFRETREPP